MRWWDLVIFPVPFFIVPELFFGIGFRIIHPMESNGTIGIDLRGQFVGGIHGIVLACVGWDQEVYLGLGHRWVFDEKAEIPERISATL